MKIVTKILLAFAVLMHASGLLAAPVGYSVNSDEPGGDSLYSIDLETGVESVVGKVQSLGITRTDVEGMAFDRFDILWAVDDESRNLFPINTATGQVFFDEEVPLSGLNSISGNDFGLTFTCGGEIYVSTVADQTLYRLTLDGNATAVGAVGGLGANISAIAAYGKPATLYGLGNGMLSEDGPRDNRSLYLIDTNTGTATVIGKVGGEVADYFQAGLSFDDEGNLWGVTDRRSLDQALGSEVLSFNINDGKATVVATTSVTGFESLAVGAPAGCEDDAPNVIGSSHMAGVIPTLDWAGKSLFVLALMLAAWVFTRRQA